MINAKKFVRIFLCAILKRFSNKKITGFGVSDFMAFLAKDPLINSIKTHHYFVLLADYCNNHKKHAHYFCLK